MDTQHSAESTPSLETLPESPERRQVERRGPQRRSPERRRVERRDHERRRVDRRNPDRRTSERRVPERRKSDRRRTERRGPQRRSSERSNVRDVSIPGLKIYLRGRESRWPLVVRSAERQTGWRVYHDLSVEESERGGTTLHYQGKPYRIDTIEECSDTSWTYRLKRWPRDEVWQHLVRLTPEDFARDMAEKKAFARARELEEISIYYEFLLGFLPSRLQNRAAEVLRFSPEHASRTNAVLEFAVFFALAAWMTMALARSLARGDSGLTNASFVVVFTYWLLAVEGLVRYGHALATQGPCGLFALEVAEKVLLFLRRGKRTPNNTTD
jgi:hypothetical protein